MWRPSAPTSRSKGDDIDTEALLGAIETVGAVLHSIDEVVAGDHIIERVARVR